MLQNPAKVVLVTGAARRIGAIIARILHESGMNIALHYHTSRHEAEQLCHELNSQRNHSAVIVEADLNDITNFPPFIEKVANHWGRLDFLVNNAARFYKTKLNEAKEEAWEDLMTSNLKAPFFLTQAAASYLKIQQGSVVNIADIHGERPMRDYSVYCISKAGLIMLTKSLAKEFGPDVRVNAVSPGPVIWPEESNALTDEEKIDLIDRTLLKRAGDAMEVAKTVLFLLRDAHYITGQVIAVDAGRSVNL